MLLGEEELAVEETEGCLSVQDILAFSSLPSEGVDTNF